MSIVTFPSVKPETESSRLPDTFARDMFLWLNQVQSDHEISSTAFRLAFVISQFMNRRSREAWPGQPLIADRAGIKPRTVRDALTELVGRGHLKVTRTGDSNRYRWLIKSQGDRHEIAAPTDARPARICRSDRRESADQTGGNLPTNHLNEPSEETSERVARAGSGLRTGQKRSRPGNQRPKPGNQQPTTWPDQFSLSAENEAYAVKQGYRQDQAADMFNHFRKHCLATGRRYSDWNFGWELWVDRQREFQKTDRSNYIDGRL